MGDKTSPTPQERTDQCGLPCVHHLGHRDCCSICVANSIVAAEQAARKKGWVAAEDYYGLDHNSRAMQDHG